MKKYIVKKGKHRFWPLNLNIWWNKKELHYFIQFDFSCKYNLQNNDQYDINKIIGIGYFDWFWPPHHVNSARFGWNYNIKTDRIDIYSYCYINKERKCNYLCSFDFNTKYELILNITQNSYIFNVVINNQTITYTINKTHNKKLSFILDPYFGGNETAPNNMFLYLQNYNL